AGATTESHAAYEAALAAASDDDEACAAWLGLAAARRILDDLAGAAEALSHAERAAVEHGLVEQRARVHFLRGNLLFPGGDIEGCRREHRQSLRLAREARSIEQEVAALGGLGDTEFMAGRMQSALERF